MPARVLFTLALPEPAPGLLEPVAELVVLGRSPAGDALPAALRGGVDVLCPQLGDRVDAAVLDAGRPRLRAVCTYSVGYEHIDVAACTERGVAVGNTPGVLTDATADCALGLIIAAARRLCEGDRVTRAGGFGGWAPDFMLGLELRGALLAVVGFGRIGQAVARRALACGMQVAYVTRDGGAAAAGAPATAGAPNATDRPPATALPPARYLPDDLAGRVTRLELADALEHADVVSLHVPLTEATRHLVDEAALRRMRPSAILVNTSRGAVVDEAALARALREGWIAGAGLDVYEAEPRVHPGLLDCPTAVLAPHLGSATVRTRAAMAELVAHNTLAALDGALPPHCVNPQAWDRGAPASLLPGAPP